tara:strand:+ start:155 stop:388 length:234 start_codon:yes stop_codon:yes gene_type:complete
MKKEDAKIILLKDVIETKLRKEKELDYYQKQLEELQMKMVFLKKDIHLTNTIINIIESENIMQLEPLILDKNIRDEL